MKLFGKIKAYQVFLTWVVLGLFFDPFEKQIVGNIILAVYLLSFVGWVYLVGKFFNNRSIETIRIKGNKHEIWFLIWYVAGIGMCLSVGSENGFLPVLGFIGFVSCILSIRFTAKSIKQFTTGSKQGFWASFPEFLMVCFSIFGVWVIQPKINEIAQLE